MLRIQFKELANTVTMQIEGRFVGNFAENARRAVADSKHPSSLLVDLSAMTFVDDIGEEVLSWLKELGSKFTAGTAYSHDVCERLQLPLAS
jgi:anti-anti-sigma regulatory factor